MTVGLVYDPVYLRHDTGQHPENARRLEAVTSHLEQAGLRRQLVSVEPRPATVQELALVHEEDYIRHIQEVAEVGGGWLDSDTVVSPGSYLAASYAAGGVIAATEAVVEGRVASAFALVRPPGHHATARMAMGFCLFNNVAVAASYALARYDLERVAIIDFDVHHGNGIQEAFYDDPRVLYISTHQYPYYPGSGGIEETGIGLGQGTTVNVPLPAGCGDGEYQTVFEEVVVPVTRRFEPRLILVSAGYDGHWADELAMMQVTVTGFARLVGTIKNLANELCHGRLVLSLEGGYDLAALSSSVGAAFDILLGKADIEDPVGQPPYVIKAPDVSLLVEKASRLHRLS